MPPTQRFSARESLKAAEAEYPPFEFEDFDGTVYQMTHPLVMDGATQRRLMELQESDDDAGHDAFMSEQYPEAWAAIQDMPPRVQRDLMEAMAAHFDKGLGDQGKGSSPSSATKKAAKPSKRTSRPAGSTSGKRPATKRPQRSKS